MQARSTECPINEIRESAGARTVTITRVPGGKLLTNFSAFASMRFKGQFEWFPKRAFGAPRIEIQHDANQAEQKRSSREKEIALSVQRKLIRAVVRIKWSAIPIGKE